MSVMDEREILERLTIGVEFSRLVLGVLTQRAGGELRITREEIEKYDNKLELAQYVDEETNELILRLEKREDATIDDLLLPDIAAMVPPVED